MNKGIQVFLDLVKDDKGCKILVGLFYVKCFLFDYVYVIDGDDWFNIDIIEYVYKFLGSDLFYVNLGYVVNLVEKIFLKKFGFCCYCGLVYIYSFVMFMKFFGLF